VSTMTRPTTCALALLLVPLPALAAEVPLPRWVWVNPDTPRARQAFFRHAFEVPGEVAAAELTGVADFCHLTISLNGKRVAEVEDFGPRFHLDVSGWVRKGENLLAVRAASHSGPAALALRLRIKGKDGSERYVVTDRRWLARRDETGSWAAASDLGGLDPEPWGDHPDTVSITALDDYTQWKQALGSTRGADPSRFFTRPGFEIELLRSAGKGEGSWVSLEFDPKGRLIIAREDRGLLRLTLAGKDRKVVRVETVNDTLKECRGLLYAHGTLYANANESRGLFRLRDTDGDDRFDEVKQLLHTEGGPGHGRNDLALGPDGRIYAIHGDAVVVPRGAHSLRSPFAEHGQKGRYGFVLRMDGDGKHPEVVTTGMRNPFGIAFNPDGEMFTYDADAEFDTGSSWYRPTRILHLLPGGDYGWRAVTGTWPPYDPDNAEAAPPSLDIGKGSPTAVKFGTRSKFPPRYQRALFVLDWAYGRVLAVHMTPRGAGYAMRAETFLKGRPFNVTDLGFGPDGAMYLVTGGRKTQAGLYRVRYVGPAVKEGEPTRQQAARARHSARMRELRRRLEAFHGKHDPAALEAAWPHLDNPDPFLRHAARIAVEHQPLDTWRKRALAEERPLAALTALLALAQGCPAEDRPAIIDRLGRLPLGKMSVSQQVIALRIYEIVLSRHGPPDSTLIKRCLAKLDPLYPAPAPEVNRQLSRLLVRLNAPDVVPRTLGLLARATSQREQFHYIHVLRGVRDGWTPESHREYFRWLARMPGFVGGEGMPGFISRIRSEATARLSEKERALLAPLLERKPPAFEVPAEARGRAFVRDWKSADLMGSLGKVDRGRDFARGQKLFRAAACSACHRMGRVGAAVGPDLTSVARRFSRRDILESILDPDRVVAEQYRRDVISTRGGKVYVGTILQGGDYRSPELRLVADPLEPGKVTKIAKGEIESHQKSETSIMPAGLLNTLTEGEVLDLLAYLEAGGDPRHPLYRK
jgi:putative heme-binding domain-containing protein